MSDPVMSAPILRAARPHVRPERASRSPVADSRVEPAIEQVGDEVGHDHGQRDQQKDPEDHRRTLLADEEAPRLRVAGGRTAPALSHDADEASSARATSRGRSWEKTTATQHASPARSVHTPGKIKSNEPASRSARSQRRVGPRK